MGKIDEIVLDSIPRQMRRTRGHCQDVLKAVDRATAALGYVRPKIEIIHSWQYTELDAADSLLYMNGGPTPGIVENIRVGWLPKFRATIEAYNADLVKAPGEAQRIEAEAPYYFRTAWERCNAIALAIAGDAGEQIYRPLVLTDKPVSEAK